LLLRRDPLITSSTADTAEGSAADTAVGSVADTAVGSAADTDLQMYWIYRVVYFHALPPGLGI